MRLLELNTHLTGEALDEIISNPVRGILQFIFMVIAIHVNRRAHVDRVIDSLLAVCTSTNISHITVDITCDFAWVRPQLLEQLVCFHQVDERLEALALLVDFLILASVQKLFLDLVEELILMGHDVVMVVRFLIQISFVTILTIVFLFDEKTIDKLLQCALIVLRILLVVLAADVMQILL